MIDSEGTRNLVSSEFIKRLGIKEELHPKSYKLRWFNNQAQLTVAHEPYKLRCFSNHTQLTVANHCLLYLGLSNQAVDSLYFNVVSMDITHTLMGWTWLYDRDIVHHASSNSNVITMEEKHQV